ncbi:MAG: bile acid:sodium symporter family protein [Planctomycetales bacterium]|nr:bile acid:sodium symporter family protein [Planctomycetales bacterium]
MQRLRTAALVTVAPALAICLFGAVTGRPAIWQPAAVFAALAAAIGIRALERLASFQFTAWILAAVTVGMIYPRYCLSVGPIDLRNKWLLLFVVQAVMFGMGTQMHLRDFAGVLRMPWGVVVGLACQFSVMPLVGYALIHLFTFPPEIAAGVILIGSCSSGLASNVMVYFARGNLALSITLTSVATMLAPLFTPLWMRFLAGALVEVSVEKMKLDIVKIVLVPMGAALLADALTSASPRTRRVAGVLACLTGGLLIASTLVWERYVVATTSDQMQNRLALLNFTLGAYTVGAAYYFVCERLPAVRRVTPLASMFGIIYFTAVTTAAGRDNLLTVGVSLFLAAVLHNALGYCFGFTLSRLCGLNRTDARTVAFEVGLQNGGMASGIAGSMGKLGTLGLASAIFSPWMNISGSLLANFWRRREAAVADDDDKTTSA